MKLTSIARLALATTTALGVIGGTLTTVRPVQADESYHQTEAFEAAQQVTDSLINAVLTAVLEVTGQTTEETVGTQSQVISLLLPRSRPSYRLLDGTGDPINRRNRPRGRFEREAVARALEGETTQVVRGNKLVTVLPLPNATENCALCHDEYAEREIGEIVGVVYTRVPLKGNHDDDDD